MAMSPLTLTLSQRERGPYVPQLNYSARPQHWILLQIEFHTR